MIGNNESISAQINSITNMNNNNNNVQISSNPFVNFLLRQKKKTKTLLQERFPFPFFNNSLPELDTDFNSLYEARNNQFCQELLEGKATLKFHGQKRETHNSPMFWRSNSKVGSILQGEDEDPSEIEYSARVIMHTHQKETIKILILQRLKDFG